MPDTPRLSPLDHAIPTAVPYAGRPSDREPPRGFTWKGRDVWLSRMEARLWDAFVKAPDRYLDNFELTRAVWRGEKSGRDEHGDWDRRAIYVLVRQLRRRLPGVVVTSPNCKGWGVTAEVLREFGVLRDQERRA